MRFPAGKELDALSQKAGPVKPWTPKVRDMRFSLSGVEHKMKQRIAAGEAPETVARFVLESLTSAVIAATAEAMQRYGEQKVLYSGGVASNSLLRQRVSDGIFAQPRYSTDNAMGCAILTWRAVHAHG